MISCVVCSRNLELSRELKENIVNTVGCPYELIVIDNSSNEYTIFSAYNEGVSRSKGDIVCFLHEDILFHSIGWGVEVINAFKNEDIGLIGVIGSQFLPNKIASWWLCQTTVGHILQGDNGVNGKYYVTDIGNEVNEMTDVVVVDGLWFCIRRDLLQMCKFDTGTYNSFHCYDVDICMQVLFNEKRVVVVPNILIEHRSMGNVLGDYYYNLELFYNKC